MMKNVLKRHGARQAVVWLLIAVIVVYIITGFGMTEYRIIEPLTFELLTKLLAFKIHTVLWGPFLILLILHIYQRTRTVRGSTISSSGYIVVLMGMKLR